MKKAIYAVGFVVVAIFVWRLAKRMLPVPRIGPRQTMTPKQKAIDDNAPVWTYARIVPPIAQNVQPNGANIRLKRNDSFIPALYTLPAMGPNGNT